MPLTLRPLTTASFCQRQYGLTAAGLPRSCPKRATMQIDGKPVCDRCAEDLLTAATGRPVSIHRNGDN